MLEFIELNNQLEIDQFIISQEETGHILQSYEWGELRRSEGHIVKRFGLKRDGKIIVLCQLVLHRLPKWYPSKKKYIGEVWRGPVVDSTTKISEFEFFLDKIQEWASGQDVVFIKFEPRFVKGIKFESSLKKLCIIGEDTFIPSTLSLNIDRSEEMIYSGIDKVTRKNIRKAERKGVLVDIVTNQDKQRLSIHDLYKLLEVTSNRAGFRVRSRHFYDKLIAIQSKYFKQIIIEARVDGNIAAAYLCLIMGDTIYTPYSGSDRKFSEYKANDLINWQLIKYAKSIGLKKYDQWGILPEDAPTHDTMWGVTRFKLAFGGNREDYIGAYDLVVDQSDYKLFSFAWSVRLLLKNIKKKYFKS